MFGYSVGLLVGQNKTLGRPNDWLIKQKMDKGNGSSKEKQTHTMVKHSPAYIDLISHSCWGRWDQWRCCEYCWCSLLCSKYSPSQLHKPLLVFFSPPSTCLSFTRPLFPRVFSDAIFNPWKDECCVCRRGKNGITVLEIAARFLPNAATSSEYGNVGQDCIILGVGECDSGQFVPCERLFFLWKLGKLKLSPF